MLDHAPGFFVEDAIVDLPPTLPTIFAPLHSASTGRRVDVARIVAVNYDRRSQRSFALKRQRTGIVFLAIGLGNIETVFRADIEQSICIARHKLSFLPFPIYAMGFT